MIDLAIIPARAGSQGLPGKNIAKLGNHPLIAWTVRAACVSKIFKRVIVSTDGKDIAAKAEEAGAEIPFIRPSYLATPEAGSTDVVQHALNEIQVDGSFALLQPTSPFRNAKHLISATSKFQDSKCESLISVVKSKPLSWQFLQEKNGALIRVSQDRNIAHRRQDAEFLVTPNGAMYFCTVESFRINGGLFPKNTLSYQMSLIDSLDIDDADDLKLAQAIVDQGLRGID